MKNRRTPPLLRGMLPLLLIGLSSTTLAVSTDESVFQKTFSQKFEAIAIENLSGRTEVQTWNSNRVRITASQHARPSPADLEARIRFQIQESDLRIIVRSGKLDEPVDLLVFVPRQVTLGVKGEADTIAIRGMTNALTVETESGAISVYLSKDANTDLSLRSIAGTISSQLEMRVFGPVNEHTLDGQTGRGGTPVILRSMRGAVSLLADEPGRIARADATLGTSDSPSNDPSSVAADDNRPRPSAGPNIVSRTDPNDPPVADIIKIDTRLVNLNVRVTDQTGKLIPDLTKNDFQIFEDNIVENSLSDEDYEPRHPFDELLARIGREEAIIYPIYFDTEFEVVVRWHSGDTHDAYVTARQQLNKIADETGGTLFKADRAEDLEGVYQRVASELQTLYSVSYNPADKNYNGKWRNVRVKIKREQAVARTKRGFYAN